MNKISSALKNIPMLIASVALGFACTYMVINVITRYFFRFTIVGYEEIIVICFSATVFLGGAAAYKEGLHYGVDALVNSLPDTLQRVMQIILYSLILCISAYCTLLAWQLSAAAWTKLFPATGIPYFFFDLPAVICFALIAVYTIEDLYMEVKNSSKSTAKEAEDK